MIQTVINQSDAYQLRKQEQEAARKRQEAAVQQLPIEEEEEPIRGGHGGGSTAMYRRGKDGAITDKGFQEQPPAANPAKGTRSWDEAIAAQQAEADNERATRNHQIFEGIVGINEQDVAARKQAAEQRDVANATSFYLASRPENGGKLPVSVCRALTAQFGQPIYGGAYLKDGSFAYLGPSQTEKNKIGIVARVDPATQKMIMQRANLPETKELETQIWDKHLASSYTPTQLRASGFRDPRETVIPGNVASRLFGRPQERSAISAVGFDGKGGKTNYKADASTGHELEVVDAGTRDPNQKATWKLVLSGPQDGWKPGYKNDENGEVVKDKNGKPVIDTAAQIPQQKVYENSKTGERVTVKDGEQAPWEKPSGSDKLAIEQLKQDNMNKRAQMRDDQQTRKMEQAKLELDEKIQKRLATAKTADERNKILSEAKQAEIKRQQENIEAKYAQMALQYGSGEAKQKAKEKVAQKLDGGDKATIKPGDNSNRNVKTDKNGVEWEIVYDENGKAVGKRRIKK